MDSPAGADVLSGEGPTETRSVKSRLESETGVQPDRFVVLALVALPFLGAVLAPLVHRVLGERTAYFAAAIAAGSLALVGSLFGTHGTVVVPWIPNYGVSLAFYVDGLALLIGTLASGVGVLVFIYSGGYMHGEPGQAKYYATLLAFMGSMLGVAFAADLIALFVFWELTSVSSFLLIGHYQDAAASQYAARKSMLVTVAGGLFMLVGFLLLAVVAAAMIDPSPARRNAETGVGASIAFGSQMWKGTWADLVAAPTPTSRSTGTNSPCARRASTIGSAAAMIDPSPARRNAESTSGTPAATTASRRKPTSMNSPPATVISIDFRAAYREAAAFW